MGPICPTCDRIHPTTRAVGLFDPAGIRGYRADYPDSPIRPTRTEAEQDWCDYMRAKEDR